MESRERFGDKKEDENIYGGMTQETQECQKHLLAGRITEVFFPGNPEGTGPVDVMNSA